MPDWPVTIVGLLARVAVLQLVAWLVVRAISSRLQFTAPQTCRVACLVILLQGVLLLPMTVSIPWYDPVPKQPLPTANVVMPARTDSDGILADPDWTERDGGTLLVAAPTEPQVGRRETAIGWDLSAAVPWFAAGLVTVWLGGMVVLAARSVLAYTRFVGSLPESLPAPRQWPREWEQLLSEQGVRRRIPLIVTERLGPMLCLLPRGYTLLVPEGYWRASRRAERMAILRHELAHYRRGDILKSWLAGLLALPSWFNPAAWWALRTFRECGEHGCDLAAVASPRERLDYARALRRLVAAHAPEQAAGHCAHSHPLVSRVRFLLTSPDVENPVMKKAFLLIAVLTLLAVHCVHVQLVAKEVTWTKASAKQRVEDLDAQLKSLGAKVDEMKGRAAVLVDEVETKLDQLKGKVEDLSSLSEEAQRRVELLKSGEKAKQLEAIEGAETMGDEGVLLLGGAAGLSHHQDVRRQAIATAVGLGKTGFPVLAHAMESLPEEDRLFAVEQLAKDADDDKLLVLGYIAHKAEGPLHAAAVKAGAASKHRVLFVAAVASEAKDEQIIKLIDIVSNFEGDDGILLLYAAAGHTSPELRIAAVRAAVARGHEGLPVVAPAFECNHPQVRAEVVRCAKKIGGDVAQWIIDEALADPDEELRNAAKEAVQESQ